MLGNACNLPLLKIFSLIARLHLAVCFITTDAGFNDEKITIEVTYMLLIPTFAL